MKSVEGEESVPVADFSWRHRIGWRRGKVVIEESTRVENKARDEWRFSRDTREKRLSCCES